MLELERRLKSAACDMSLEYARELTKTMYRISFILPDSKVERHVLLGLSPEQSMLVDLAQN